MSLDVVNGVLFTDLFHVQRLEHIESDGFPMIKKRSKCSVFREKKYLRIRILDSKMQYLGSLRLPLTVHGISSFLLGVRSIQGEH